MTSGDIQKIEFCNSVIKGADGSLNLPPLVRKIVHAIIPLSGRLYLGQALTGVESIGATCKAHLPKNRKTPAFHCPCCGTRAPFKSGNFTSRPNRFNPERYRDIPQEVLCPICGSFPRHRILALWCKENKRLLKKSRILYFSMEKSMHYWFWKHRIQCITADISDGAQLRLDIQQIDLPDADVDMVFCNHVLEHVDDFRTAIRELYRILRPGGYLICSFPIDPGIDLVDEGPADMSSEERIRRFGQSDHIRVFGPNADEFLTDAGFAV